MSVYPGAFDAFPEHLDSTGGTREVIHAEDINSLGRAIAAIQLQLGLLPAGTYASLAQRIDSGGFFRFAQGAPLDSWAITHTLGGLPSVTIVDSAGSVVIGEVTYLSDTDIVVDFSSAFSGYAYLS